MGYAKEELLEMCRNEAKRAFTLYQADCINYRGQCSDTGEFYSEVIAAYICRHIETFKAGIPTINRTSSYRQPTHDGKFNPTSNRAEEIMAMQMFNYCKAGDYFPWIGKIIDYQTPLKAKRTDTAGKIDLLAYDGETLRFLELKRPDSEETMLRCVLEGYTYLRTANPAKLLSDFDLPAGTRVVAGPLVFNQGNQWAELFEDRPHLKRLMALLGSEPFAYDEHSMIVEQYDVSDRERGI